MHNKLIFRVIIGGISLLFVIVLVYLIIKKSPEKQSNTTSVVGISATLPTNNPKQITTSTQSPVQFVDSRGYFMFAYPSGWKTFTSKGQDTSLGDVLILPARNAQFIVYLYDSKDYPRLPDGLSISEYIKVSGGVQYSFASDREKYLPDFRSYMLGNAEKAKKQTGITNFTEEEVSYGDAPAFVFKFNRDGKIEYHFMALAKGTPSSKSGPVLVGFEYVATSEYYDQNIADMLRNSFSDNVASLIDQQEKAAKEREGEENKEMKAYTITSNSSADPNKPLSNLLTDWDGRYSSDPTETRVKITQTSVDFTDKTEKAITIKLDALGESGGIFRNFAIPKDTYAIRFCLNFQGVAGKDNITVLSNNKLLLNYGMTSSKLSDFVPIDAWTKMYSADTGMTAPLQVFFINRSGTPTEVTLSRFKIVSVQEASQSLNCKTR